MTKMEEHIDELYEQLDVVDSLMGNITQMLAEYPYIEDKSDKRNIYGMIVESSHRAKRAVRHVQGLAEAIL